MKILNKYISRKELSNTEDFLNKILRYQKLSLKERNILKKLKKSDDPHIQLLACHAIIRETKPRVHYSIIKILEKLSSLGYKIHISINLLDALSELRASILIKNLILKKYIYNAVKHSNLHVRLNSTQCLAKLARLKDKKAIYLLVKCLRDPEEYVRNNAKVFLEKLGLNPDGSKK